AQQVAQLVVGPSRVDAVTVATLPKGREGQSEQRGKVLLDVAGDDPADRRSALQLLDALIEPRERDDRLDGMIGDGLFELVFGVNGIERCDDCPDFPGGE